MCRILKIIHDNPLNLNLNHLKQILIHALSKMKEVAIKVHLTLKKKL